MRPSGRGPPLRSVRRCVTHPHSHELAGESWLTRQLRRTRILTRRGGALSDVKLVQLLSGVSALLQIDVFDVAPFQIVLAIGERLKLLQHDVIHVQLHVVERVEQRVDEP